MRKKHLIYLLTFGGILLTGCVDTTIEGIQVEKPQSIAQYEYLNQYGPLKEYIDRGAHPGFLLASGVSATDYNDKGIVYRLTNSNFDEMTAGNEMKYASIVDDQGNMNFSTVEKFVENARNAGMKIYGHTLCWHEQQNVKWLNSLISDKEVEIDPGSAVEIVDMNIVYSNFDSYPYYRMSDLPQIENGLLVIDNPDPDKANWEVQYFVIDGCTFNKGGDYIVTTKIKGSKPGTLNVSVGDWGGQANQSLDFTDEWSEVSVPIMSVPAESGFVIFQSGTLQGKLEIEWVKLSHKEAASVKYYESIIHNGDAEGDDVSSFFAVEDGGLKNARIVENPDGEGHVYAVNLPANPVEAWDAQFFIRSNDALQSGDRVHVAFRYKCTDERNIDTQAHGEPTNYHHWQFIGTLNATTEWKEHDWTGVISGDQAGAEGCYSIAFNLSSVPNAGTFYIDDIVYEIEKSGNTIPLTPEEKAEVLTAEMERWVKGMMEATQGYVTAWDVVNEAISGAPWGQRYDLQHASSDPNAASKFYWQDYLGDNFVRVPVKFARQYFEENGGNPSDLKLFINDYNLESDWDNNQKLKSLIQWIEQWESDGVTKIDGIGSQMHVSYHMNPQTQASKEKAIEEMFRLMAASGKLVRISELDMGICDESGNAMMTSDITFEQEKLMADYYEFIVRKYFEIIPVAQQYGICHWAQTDSPENSGWRKGEPIGLWTLDFQRKPAYEGFVKGLSGK